MHFSYVEIGDNFVPDIVTDQFRRVPVKFGITLNKGDDMTEAITTIKQAIKEYIEKNTVYHSPNAEGFPWHPFKHVGISNPYPGESLPPEPAVLPSIQKETIKPDYKVVIEEIENCKTMDELRSWEILAASHAESIKAYIGKSNKINNFNIINHP
jgi:hypothetical protein